MVSKLINNEAKQIKYVLNKILKICSMNVDKLFDFYVNESKTPFEGLNFNYINGRLEDLPLPWNYRSIILSYVLESNCLLDIWTGG